MFKENKIAIGLIIFMLCFGIIVASFLMLKKEQVSTTTETETPFNMELVSEYSYFFSVVNNLNKYLFYNYSKNNVALYNSLSKEYLSQFDIDVNNILTKLEIYENEPSIKVKEMYYKVNDNKYIYYVIGTLVASIYESNITLKENVSYFVLVDYDSLAVAIYPVDNEINNIPFQENQSVLLNNYNGLEASGVINDNYICNLYYSDFISKVFNNIEDSYDLLDENLKKKSFSSQSQYIEYMQNKMDSISLEITSCKETEKNNKRIYTISDGVNTFKFTEESIMNYKVSFN